MTREELAKAIREDYERKGVWACKSNTINMQLDFEILGIILEALEQDTVSKESYDHEYFLRRKMEAEIEHLRRYISKLETQITLEQEPTTKNDEVIEGCECFICKYGDWKRKGWSLDMADDKCGGCCSWSNKYEPIEPTTKNDLGIDCISRADAIHAVSEALKRTFVEYEDIANKVIGKLPSVTPQEPRKGEWLRMSDLPEQDDYRYKCSRCGNVIHHKSKMDLYTFNSWCGRCGSDNGKRINYEVEIMTREELRDYVEFLRSQNEISYDVYSGLIDGIDTLEQEPILDRIKENIQFIKDKCLPNNIAEEYEQKGLQEALDIINKYKAESEDT